MMSRNTVTSAGLARLRAAQPGTSGTVASILMSMAEQPV
jgi:hypothetical protein